MTTRSCGACFKPYRGKARAAVLVGGTRKRSALVCPRCAAGGVLVVVEVGAVTLALLEQQEADRKAVAASRRRASRASKVPRGLEPEAGDELADLTAPTHRGYPCGRKGCRAEAVADGYCAAHGKPRVTSDDTAGAS